ncbi:MAG: hypothetical protein Satyrvirus21_20, partial [Satyrvirus sp.]
MESVMNNVKDMTEESSDSSDNKVESKQIL